MVSATFSDPDEILILKADRLCASILGQAAQRIFPGARFRVAATIDGATAALAAQPVNLLITGLGFLDGDILDLLAEKPAQPRRFRRALVVTGRRELRLLTALKTLPIQGVFDPTTEELEQFEVAIKLVAGGSAYWSASILARLTAPEASSRALCHLLSPTEQLVFAVIGDGCDDTEAAGRLALRPSTVHSVRRELHRKLGVQHKGELVRMAVLHGYVRFTADGVHRPGFSGLLAACRPRRPRAAAAAEHPSNADTPILG
jgi:DNA-binding NarL/FixJ family response regulator